MKKLFSPLLALCALFVACQEKGQEAEITVASVSVTPASAELVVGESRQLTAAVLPADATDKTVIWSSSSEAVASVDQSGKVTALKEGSATITAKAGTKTGTCQVSVGAATVAVASVTLNLSRVNLTVGGAETLEATVLPADATDKTVTWSSSDESIVTVDADGVLTALKGGTATVTASAGEVSASAFVDVMEVTPSSVVLNGDGGTFEVKVIAERPYHISSLPEWIEEKSVENQVHVFEAQANPEAGERTGVIALCDEDGACLSCVVKQTGNEGMEVSPSELSFEHTGGKAQVTVTTSLEWTAAPADAWCTVTPASGSGNGSFEVEVPANTEEGVRETTVTLRSGSFECTVLVSQAGVIAVTSVVLDKERLNLTVGAAETLVATVAPADATDKTVTWSSSDKSVATVDQNGLVTALKGGTATVSAKAGNVTASALVDVMAVTPSSVEVPGTGGSFDVEVTSARPYHISSLPEWVKEQSVENQVHHFVAEANPMAEDRSGVIAICDDEGACLSCMVKQAGLEHLSLSSASLEVDAAGGSFDISVNSTQAWTASAADSWCTLNPSSGSGNGSFTVSVPAFNEAGKRSTVITVKAGQLESTVTVEQEGKAPFALTPEEVELPCEGGTFEVQVTSSIGYSVTALPDWVSDVTGTPQNNTHVFEVAANHFGEARSGHVFFMDDAGTGLKVAVKQAANLSGPSEIDWNAPFTHKSLFMRFTATWCGYCPMMAQSVKKAQEQLPGKIEAVSLHGNGSDLYFAAANPLLSLYKINGYPTGVVDAREQISNSNVTSTANNIVNAVKRTENNLPTSTAIGWNSTLSGRNLSIDLSVFVQTADTYKVTVLLVEDGIVGYQADYNDGDHQDYVHDGVARVAVSDIAGVDFTTVADRQVYKHHFTTSIPATYKKDNMRIVVYVQRAYGQVSKVKSSDYKDFFVDNCATGKVGEDKAPDQTAD